MHNAIQMIKTYMEREPGLCEDMSIMDILYNGYTEQEVTDDHYIQQEFAELDDVLSKLTLKEYDRVWDATCRLCSLHERRAFCAGLHMGIDFMMEMAQNGQREDTCF